MSFGNAGCMGISYWLDVLRPATYGFSVTIMDDVSGVFIFVLPLLLRVMRVRDPNAVRRNVLKAHDSGMIDPVRTLALSGSNFGARTRSRRFGKRKKREEASYHVSLPLDTSIEQSHANIRSPTQQML